MSGSNEAVDLAIDGERLWDSLTAMGRIGALPGGGVRRLAYTPEDVAAREQFAAWCRAEGCEVRLDAIGNLFARRAGREDLPPLQIGSHLDTQPAGGRFDGVLGVLAGLEVIRTLNSHGIATRRPVEVIAWAAEEGARFAPAMLGSAVHTGTLAWDEALRRRDGDGVGLAQALADAGLAAAGPVARSPAAAYLELHIEQGPVLEAEETAIGVVDSVAGIRWFDVVFRGLAAHAGPYPMALRRDAQVAASDFVCRLERLARGAGETARATVGSVRADNPSRNSMPAQVTVAVDLRDADDERLERLERHMRVCASAVADEYGVDASVDPIWSMPAIGFDRDCIEIVRRAADRRGYGWRRIMSGAGHDAVHMARVTPTAMIFIPCRGGLSHNEEEYASPEHVIQGCQVLFDTAREIAGDRA